MGTRSNSHDTQKQLSSKPPRCSVCRKVYTPACDWNQGRCPHHPAVISTTAVRTRLQNLIKFFTRRK